MRTLAGKDYSALMNEKQSTSLLVPETVDVPFLTNLRRLGFVEGISTLVLFGVAMPLKYVAGLPIAVRIAGSVHGFLFVWLVVMLLMATRRVPISRLLAVAGILAAVVPFGPFVFDRWLPSSTDHVQRKAVDHT